MGGSQATPPTVGNPPSAPPGPAEVNAAALVPAGGARQCYGGVNAILYHRLGGVPRMDWGEILLGAGLVGTVQAYAEVIASVRWALDAADSGRGTLFEFRERVAHVVDGSSIIGRRGTTLNAATRDWNQSSLPGPSYAGE